MRFLRAEGNYDVDKASDEAGLCCEDVSLAKQSFREECDINTIIERFGLGYEMPDGVVAPTYGDFTHVRDFHTAMNAIASANEAFDALPASVRARFQNDPGQFVDFVSEESNRAEAESLGLVVSRTPPATAPAAAPPQEAAQSTT